MIRAVPLVRAMSPYALADMGGGALVSLAQNESAFAASPRAVEAGQAALATAALYPDPDWAQLTETAASLHRVERSKILFGAGSMELIGSLIRAFSGPGDQVLGTDYGYVFVATAAAQAGAQYVTVPEPEFTVCVDHLLAAVTAQTRIVFVCNPGNPTGTRLPNAEIIRLREGLPADVLLVVDQAYGEFDDQGSAPVFALARRGDTVITRTLSKAYGLAGARVGWGVFPHAIAQEVRKLLNPNNVSGVSQAMARAALLDQAYMRDVVARTAQARDVTATRLRQSGVSVPPSHTNFLLLCCASVAAAQALDAGLRGDGLLLRGMAGYGLGHCLRATVGTQDVMDRLAASVAAHMEGPANGR